MPTSNLELAPRILHHLWQIRQQQPWALRVLDVGPGRGKYGLLIREYVDHDAVVDAVESEPRYRTERLGAIYDTLFCNDVMDMMELGWEDHWDVVLMVDVLEHLDHAEGRELLSKIPSWVVICTPRHWFQNPEADEWPTEEHRSLWVPADFGLDGYGDKPRAGPLANRLDVYDGQAYADHGALIVRLKPLPRRTP